jgi:CheY-like chemotaxis protein
VSNPDRILVVDEASDTAEVLQAVFEPRGVSVSRIRRFDPSASGAEDLPALVVLNAESAGNAISTGSELWPEVPQVIIGTVQMPIAATAGASASTAPVRRFLRNPFQFAELMQAIESLINERPASR